MACTALQGNGRVCNRRNCRIHLYADNQEDNCAICLDAFGTRFVKNLSCGHTFHKGCFQLWNQRSNTCPTCRHPFRELPRFRVETVVNVYEGETLIETHTHRSEHIPMIALEVLMDNMNDVDEFVRNEITNTE
jgi:hypothetical protein